MELITALGIDLRIFIAQLINFAVLIFVLYRFAYRPILNLLDERKEKIKQGIEDAEKAALARSEADEEKRQIIGAANQEAIAVADRAKEYAASKANEIVAEAQMKAEQLAKDAEARVSEIKAKALKESEAEIAKIAILTAEKVLKEKSA